MKIKITKLSQLDGKENKDYRIIVRRVYESWDLEINSKDDRPWFVKVGESDTMPKATLLSLLAHFGFDIEVVEPIKLTKEEWHFVRVFNGKWMARDTDGSLCLYDKIPQRTEYGCWDSKTDYCYLEDYFYSIIKFSFITWESEPWSIESLRELECEEEIV